MKTSEFKKLIKEAVKEVFHEEMRDILLEAVRSPKSMMVNEAVEEEEELPLFRNVGMPKQQQSVKQPVDKTAIRNKFKTLTEGFETPSHPQPAVPFIPRGSGDTVSEGSSLPPGEVSMDQIMGLMTGK